MLFRRFADERPRFADVGGGEEEQIGQRRHGKWIDAVLFGEPSSQRRHDGVLIREAPGIGVAVGAPATQLGQAEVGDGGAWDACNCRREERGIEGRVMTENHDAVAGEVEVGFDAGNAGVEGRFKGGQRVFRLQAAGAAVALEVKRRHGSTENLAGTNIPARQ